MRLYEAIDEQIEPHSLPCTSQIDKSHPIFPRNETKKFKVSTARSSARSIAAYLRSFLLNLAQPVVVEPPPPPKPPPKKEKEKEPAPPAAAPTTNGHAKPTPAPAPAVKAPEPPIAPK